MNGSLSTRKGINTRKEMIQYLSDCGFFKSFANHQLNRGITVEMEHTEDKKIAQRIAMDHLVEYPDYYVQLDIMEERMKKKWKGQKCTM
jgi:hypothetical protein